MANRNMTSGNLTKKMRQILLDEDAEGTPDSTIHDKVSALQTAVGDAESGLVKDVADNQTDITALQAIVPTDGAPDFAAAASAVLTFSGNPSEGRTVTINDVTYTFVTTFSDANQIKLGETVDLTIANLRTAINQDGTPGTNYSDGTVAPAKVSAVSDLDADTLTVTCAYIGSEFNSFPKLTDDPNLDWDGEGETFTGGQDGTPAAKGAIRYEADKIWIAVTACTITDSSGWKYASLS